MSKTSKENKDDTKPDQPEVRQPEPKAAYVTVKLPDGSVRRDYK